jgi:maltooligosyltrehalose trehalohydrolase
VAELARDVYRTTASWRQIEMMSEGRRLSTGAEFASDGVHFRVFAPKRESVTVVLESDHERTFDLTRDATGHFSTFACAVAPGTLYRIRLDHDPKLYPDPTSRFQPQGPHGPSEVINPASFGWTDHDWKGTTLRGQVIYELHIGTFTREGTYASAMRELEELKGLGVTLIEMMPVHEFEGRFGWGYDGVDLYAPSHLYGRPDDLRAFIDRAHGLGLGVILDVVYNHVGPSGNYLEHFAASYFTNKYENDWGASIDFETDPGVRAYFAENGAYWIDEFHFDGLRIDAIQNIVDASPRHVLVEIVERARDAAPNRDAILIGENEPQDANLFRARSVGGYGLDALWNDDFHHSTHVAMSGRSEAYYSNTKGTPQELLSALKWGFLFQGQLYSWQKQRRGAPALDVEAAKFVLYIQNHDQIANSARSCRMQETASPAMCRAMTTVLLLAPGTPMLFQGQEFGASAPFHYFADHEPELAALVKKGRFEFLRQFPSNKDDSVTSIQLSPHDEQAFESSKLDLCERDSHRPLYELHRELLRLRREDPVFSAQQRDWMHGAVIGPQAFALRFLPPGGDDRLVLVNLGNDLDLTQLAEPLLASPRDASWRVLFSTEDVRWGGGGTPPFGRCGEVTLPGRSALVLGPTAGAAAKKVDDDAELGEQPQREDNR